MKKRRVKEFSLGFSLIEVVSGIAIILSIAGLLLSAITSAREKGLQAKCISNQKNLTAALIMYAVDHENFPTELAQLKLSPLQKERLSGAWVYADSSVPFYYDLQFGVTQCPKVQGKITDPTPTYSYGINEWVQGKSLSLITNPSETIVTSDSLNKAAISSVQDVDPRHMGGAFAGFADGHVELVKFSQLETFFTSSDTSSSLNTTDTFPSLPEGDTTGGILFYRGGVPTEEPVADENEDVEDNDDSAESEDSPPSDEDETEGKNSEDENEDENIEEPIEENDEEDLEDPTKDEEDLEDTENDDDSGEAHDNNGHGNNEDHDDEDNPGQGNGDHGHDHDEDTEDLP
ncbi:MAG: hypothetical protein HYS07_05630 [Chlamydiae bacterium]|nr:hypothetical protein [Chlamydiota bacterium]